MVDKAKNFSRTPLGSGVVGGLVVAVLGWIASQSAHLELALGLQGTHYSASLVPRCADHGDQFLLHFAAPSVDVTVRE